MDVAFYHRNFSNNQIPLDLDGIIERYSHSMLGGPDMCTLNFAATADKWELLNLLRSPLKIFGDDGGTKWWGIVNRVSIPQGRVTIGRGLDNMFNSVTVQYDKGVTAVAIDAQSKDEFGEKQIYIDNSGAVRTAAEYKRNTYLAKHKYPKDENELSGGQTAVIVECVGLWSTLGWKYYSNPSTTLVDNALQVRDIILACGQFIKGVIVENLAGISSVPRRDGRSTALSYINELLGAGSSHDRRMLATIDEHRYAHIYEQPAESPQYFVNNEGRLETLLNVEVNPQNCVHAKWVQVKDAPATANRGISKIGTFFLDRSEYIEVEDNAN